MLSFDTASPGSFSDTIVLHGTGHNASGVSGSIDDITLIVEGTVITQGPTVHGPSGFVLLLAAMLVSVAMQTQRRIRSK